MCDNNPDCMNFEYCPRYNQVSDPPVPKMCRIFDAKIWDTRNLKQVQWFDCSAYYATCKKGTRTSMNIIKNSILNCHPTLFTISVNFDILIFFRHYSKQNLKEKVEDPIDEDRDK